MRRDIFIRKNDIMNDRDKIWDDIRRKVWLKIIPIVDPVARVEVVRRVWDKVGSRIWDKVMEGMNEKRH